MTVSEQTQPGRTVDLAAKRGRHRPATSCARINAVDAEHAQTGSDAEVSRQMADEPETDPAPDRYQGQESFLAGRSNGRSTCLI